MKWLFLILIGAVLIAIFAPFLILYNGLKRGNTYLHTVAIGLDQLGGALLFGTEDYTISSYLHFMCLKNRGKWCKRERFVDFIFGAGHCKNSYENEKYEVYFKEI